MRGLDHAGAKAQALHVSPPDGRPGTSFARGETSALPASSNSALMKMSVISGVLYGIGISLFDRPDQSVPGDHRPGLDIHCGHGATHLAEVVRQWCRDRAPSVFVEPLLGRVVLFVLGQLQEQQVVAPGPRR